MFGIFPEFDDLIHFMFKAGAELFIGDDGEEGYARVFMQGSDGSGVEEIADTFPAGDDEYDVRFIGGI